MLVLSHRGYHVEAPENTLDAFARAVELGVDGIETDLRLAADGRIVLMHDRLLHDGRPVAALGRDELSAAVGYRVPTLQEALDRFENLLWNLELKVPEVAAAAAAAIAPYLGRRQFLITSFWHNVVAEVRRALADAAGGSLPDVEFGLLTADRPLRLEALVEESGEAHGVASAPAFQAIVWYFEVIDPLLLAEARRRGIANYVYGLQTPDDHRRSVALGVDGVITDRPEFVSLADG